MALTNDEQRKCYLHLGYIQVNRTGVFVGGMPQTTEVVQKLQVSLDSVTPNGETTVRELLAQLDPLRTKLFTCDSRFQAEKVDDVVLNPQEWQLRRGQYQWFKEQLARALDVPVDPSSEATSGGGGAYQGPWREP